ncbi:uncharacterized [Tachysurus ichikawai]
MTRWKIHRSLPLSTQQCSTILRPIAPIRNLCERGDIKRLKGRGSKFGRGRRGRDSLCFPAALLYTHIQQHSHHSGFFRSSTGTRKKGKGQSQAASPTGITRYRPFSHFKPSIELCSFSSYAKATPIESNHCAETGPAQ